STGNQWYKDGVLLAGETGLTYVANASGAYTVVFTDGNTCPSVASAGITVTVNPLPPAPTVTASGLTTFCAGGSITLTSSASTGNQWYKDGVILAGATGQTYVANASGTYTAVFTDGNTCPSAASAGITVTVNPLPPAPTITASGLTTFCAGGSVTLTSSALTGNQWYRDGVLLSGATGQTYVANASGAYTVVFTDGNTCPSAASAGITITVNPLPPAPTVTASGPTIFCAGGSVTLSSSSATSYQWYRGTTLLTGETQQTYTAIESGSYTVVVTDGNSCASPASASVSVTVNPLPAQPTVTASGLTTFCAGGSVILTSSSAVSYQWYRGNILLTGETQQTYTATESGKYTVVVTNASNCAGPVSNEVMVTVNALPIQPVITANGGTIFCDGESVVLSTSANGSYQWYLNGTPITNATGQTYEAKVAGKYTVVVTNTSNCASPVSNEITVTVNALPVIPTITAMGNTVFCIGNSVTLTSSAASGYQWYKDGAVIPGASSKTYIATETGAYHVLVTNVNGCSSSPSLPTQVTASPYPELPNISPAGVTTFCEGGVVTLTSSSAAGNQWYKNGILIPGANGQTLGVNEIGNYTVKVTNQAGCASTMSAATNVTVNKVPKGFDDVVNSLSCTQSSFSYNLQTKNVNNIQKGGNAVPAGFSWTVNSTVTGAVNGSGKVLNATLINTTTTEQYVVYLVTPIAEAGGCAGQPFKITVRVPVCLDITITKSANRTNVSAPGDEIKYSIVVSNNGNANHSHVKVNDPLLGGLLYRSAGDNGNDILEKGESWIYSGTYTITQNNIDSFGLPDVNTGKIVNTATVSSMEYPQSKSAIAEVNIDANPSVALVKTGAMNRDFRTMTYTFTVTNNGNMTLYNLVVKDPKIIQPIVLSQTTLAPGATTSGIAQYTITNPEKVAGNVSNTATVTGLTRSGISVTDISGTAANNDDPTVIDITRYPIAIDDYANTKADVEVAVPVINNDKPALFPLDASTLEVKSQPTNGKLSVNKDGKVVYTPNKGFFGIEKFTYKVDDANGLGSNVAIVTITVVPPDLDVPNTFTPNGDGKNDTFVITGLENYEKVSLFVYNRWGDEVYRNNNYKNEWDGNGLNDGTYFYVLKLTKAGKEESRRSWILIKR
ncbi:Ig-like domain-containing protein, partial [Pedobacter africanus]